MGQSVSCLQPTRGPRRQFSANITEEGSLGLGLRQGQESSEPNVSLDNVVTMNNHIMDNPSNEGASYNHPQHINKVIDATLPNTLVVLPKESSSITITAETARTIYQEFMEIQQSGSSNELECVMCLDTFIESNPRVRTLCKCGMNRTNFHLSCLYEWIERDANCPVCREYLFFEEDEHHHTS